MVDIVITAANVLKGSNARTERGTAGGAINPGQMVYRDANDGKYKLADADGANAAAKAPRGFALNGAADGQPLEIQRSGDITIGGTLTPGITYYLSSNPGGICPVADVGTGENYVVVGIAKSATVLAIGINPSGVSA